MAIKNVSEGRWGRNELHSSEKEVGRDVEEWGKVQSKKGFYLHCQFLMLSLMPVC